MGIYLTLPVHTLESSISQLCMNSCEVRHDRVLLSVIGQNRRIGWKQIVGGRLCRFICIRKNFTSWTYVAGRTGCACDYATLAWFLALQCIAIHRHTPKLQSIIIFHTVALVLDFYKLPEIRAIPSPNAKALPTAAI